jgi:hypothetical protein
VSLGLLGLPLKSVPKTWRSGHLVSPGTLSVSFTDLSPQSHLSSPREFTTLRLLSPHTVCWQLVCKYLRTSCRLWMPYTVVSICISVDAQPTSSLIYEGRCTCFSRRRCPYERNCKVTKSVKPPKVPRRYTSTSVPYTWADRPAVDLLPHACRQLPQNSSQNLGCKLSAQSHWPSNDGTLAADGSATRVSSRANRIRCEQTSAVGRLCRTLREAECSISKVHTCSSH